MSRLLLAAALLLGCTPHTAEIGQACTFAADCRDGSLCLQGNCAQPKRGNVPARVEHEGPLAHQEESLEEKSRPGDDRQAEVTRAREQQSQRVGPRPRP